MNQEKILADFPILARKIHGKRLVYLDNAATTQKPRAVIEALERFYSESNSNIHRGIHTLAEEATKLFEDARKAVGRFIGCDDPAEIVFTKNATEAVNLVAHGWGRKFLEPGDRIQASVMEHHSNLVPWQMCSRATGAELVLWDIRPDGTLDSIEPAPRTKLVAVTHVSNVLGTINPVAEIAERARRAGALLLIDGAQSVPHMPIDVKSLGADFLVFSAHKMLGPTGVGVLWARRELLEAMDPFLGGGDMITEVFPDRATWNEVPWKFEAGTPNVGGVVAFAQAVAYLQGVGMKNVREHELELTRYALDALTFDGRAQVYGPPAAEKRGGVVAFNLGEIHPHDVATVLDRDGIATRAGHHCAQVLMKRMGLWGTNRVSFYFYNTRADVDALVRGFDSVERVFGPVPRAGCRTLPKLHPISQSVVQPVRAGPEARRLHR